MFYLLVGKIKEMREGLAIVGDHGLVVAPVYIVVGLFPTGLTASEKKTFLN